MLSPGGGGLRVARRARALLGLAGGEGEQDDGGDHDEQRTGREQPGGPTEAQREAPPLGAAQGAQDRRRLAGRVAAAGGLDREGVLEVGDERGGVRRAAALVLGGRALQHGGERGGDLGPADLDVGEVLAHVLHRHGDLVLAVERHVAGEHLEEHDAQRVDVGLRPDRVPERLLGRDVVRRAEHPAVGRQPVLVERAGDPEVRDLRRALDVDEDVLRLDVAVHDVARMRCIERPRDLDGVGDGLRHGQPAEAPDARLERLALDVLEDDVGEDLPARIALFPGVDDLDDVGVVELRDGTRLAAESLELVGVPRDVAVHELDRDRPLEDGVERAVDRRHAPRADHRIDAVARVQQRADR